MKSKKTKKSKKIKINPYKEVHLKLKNVEMAALVFVCAFIFTLSSFGSGKVLHDYIQKKNSINSEREMALVSSAVAAESQAEDIAMANHENELLAEENMIESTAEADNLAKKQSDKDARAKMIARQRAAEMAKINSAPILAGPTNKLSNGLRVCPLKKNVPSGRGGKPHIDEDCCADYDEYPNPRCQYTPDQLSWMKKP